MPILPVPSFLPCLLPFPPWSTVSLWNCKPEQTLLSLSRFCQGLCFQRQKKKLGQMVTSELVLSGMDSPWRISHRSRSRCHFHLPPSQPSVQTSLPCPAPCHHLERSRWSQVCASPRPTASIHPCALCFVASSKASEQLSSTDPVQRFPSELPAQSPFQGC